MSQTMRLYDTLEALDILDDLIAEHADRINAMGGDIEAVPEIAELLAFAEDQFEGAVERWGLKIGTLLAEAQGAKLEADRLAMIVKRKENAAARLKEYLKRQLEGRHLTKVKCPLVTVRIQKNSQPSITAISESTIEELFVAGSPFAAQKVEFVLNREAIVRAEKEGETIPQGIVIHRGTHLRLD